MHSNPFSSAGYDIAALQRAIDQKADRHEMATLRGDVDRLERALGEARSESDGLRSRLERLEEAVRELNPGLNL